MKGRFLFTTLLVVLAPAILAGAQGNSAGLLRVHGSTNIVDIGDILAPDGGKLTERDIKRVCALITDRYHSRGYSAFYIKEAVLNSDGTLDMFFNESAVTGIIVNGIGKGSEQAALLLYVKGDIFNENILRENVAVVKKRFSLKRLNVSVKRGEDDQIVLIADAEVRVHQIDAGIYGNPVYGIYPGIKYRINSDGLGAGISALSTFNLKERSYSGGSAYFNSAAAEDISGRPYFTVFAEVSDSRDSISSDGTGNTEGLFYRRRSVSPGGGICFSGGAAGINFTYDAAVDRFSGYPGTGRGVSFSGLHTKLFYDNSMNKIDISDAVSASADIFSGWNFIEGRSSGKLIMDYRFNLPVFYGYFISFNGNFFYTSDKVRYSRRYVFDALFPCRGDDFSVSSWRNVSGVDFVCDVIKRTLYISPVFKWGLYNGANHNYSVYAAGVKIMYSSGALKLGLSYLFDLDKGGKEGYLMFSAGAVYL